MYTGTNNTASSRAAAPPPWQQGEQQEVWQWGHNNSSSSGCSSHMGSPSSLGSWEKTGGRERLMQRSVSSHSLQHRNSGAHRHHHHQPPFSALFAELIQSDEGPVRRVYSTGDLQRINGMQQYHHHHQSDSSLSSESSMIIEAMSRASPYSPEEKKVRIERYRSKRNQRNFNKKIKYSCRKTLADSRPRIRGRFARNDEIAVNPQVQWSQFGPPEAEEDDDEDIENWSNFFDSLDPSNLAQEEPQEDSSSFGVFY